MNSKEVRFTENSLQTIKKKSLTLILINSILISMLLVVFVFLRPKCVYTRKAIAFLLNSKE